ncbi:MAG: hypothetical protein SWY16_09655 [Cyanobacteriota bacterium]|nr:hypothetical protein [Cyanobacteriota bacterium]
MIWAKQRTFANFPINFPVAFSLLLTLLTGCSTPSAENTDASPTAAASEGAFATVTEVEVSAGEPGAYTFAVTLESPDTGCDRYANWWEVLDAEGNLIYRRILAHSHVDEQPFQRTGGAVAVQPEDVAIVRGHMYPDGYGTQAMQGTVETGFAQVTLPEGFAADVAEVEPQPGECAY